MEFRQIRYFVAVAEELNFGRAAAELGIGQPGVSQQVARLERELGARLFDRSSRAVRLTEAGQRFLPKARAVLVACDTAKAAVANEEGAPQVLRIGSSTGLGDRLEMVLDVMRKRFPMVEIELVTASTRTRLERVRAGQLDASFVRGTHAMQGLEFIPVWEDSLVAAIPANHPLARRPDIELRALADLPLRLVRRSENQPLVDTIMSSCADAGFEPTFGPRSQALQETLAAIGTGPPSWTLVYAAHARMMRSTLVTFVPLAAPGLVMSTALAVPISATSGPLAPLLKACAEASRIDHYL
jgi:DNA-binding transcriptional LysR family regulator